MARPSIEDDKSTLLQTLNSMGGDAGNTRLRRELQWEEERYWRTHAMLVDEGAVVRGKGKGGSISIVNKMETNNADAALAGNAPVTQPAGPAQRELELYEPASITINSGWIKERGYDEALVEITALPGRKQTGGTWTRPDLAVLAVKAFPYLPGRHFDIVTFEVKKEDAVDVTGVFEALSHLQFASLSYVVFYTAGRDFEDGYRDTDRILSLAKQHGVGVIAASDIADYNSWDELVEPRRNIPDPEQANLFIGTCFSEDAKARAIKWHK